MCGVADLAPALVEDPQPLVVGEGEDLVDQGLPAGHGQRDPGVGGPDAGDVDHHPGPVPVHLDGLAVEHAFQGAFDHGPEPQRQIQAVVGQHRQRDRDRWRPSPGWG